MKKVKSGKIPTMFVKDTIEVTAPILSVIFNKSTRKGVFTKNLKIGKICPVYKGKGLKSDPDNYRSISVLPVIARVFEKLIHEQFFPISMTTCTKTSQDLGLNTQPSQHF